MKIRPETETTLNLTNRNLPIFVGEHYSVGIGPADHVRDGFLRPEVYKVTSNHFGIVEYETTYLLQAVDTAKQLDEGLNRTLHPGEFDEVSPDDSALLMM